MIRPPRASRDSVAGSGFMGGREGNETLNRLDPIWEWLMANYKGLPYAEGEGYYEGRKLILKVK